MGDRPDNRPVVATIPAALLLLALAWPAPPSAAAQDGTAPPPDTLDVQPAIPGISSAPGWTRFHNFAIHMPVTEAEVVRVRVYGRRQAVMVDGRLVYLNLLMNHVSMERGRLVSHHTVIQGAAEMLARVEGPVTLRIDTSNVLADPELRRRIVEIAQRHEIALDFSATRSTDGGLAPVREMRGLRIVHLGNTHTDRALEHLRGLPALYELQLLHVDATDAGMPLIAQHGELRILRIGRNPHVTDRAVEVLATLPYLVVLDLSQTAVSRSSVPAFRAMRSLRVLQIGAAQISSPASNQSLVRHFPRSCAGPCAPSPGMARLCRESHRA